MASTYDRYAKFRQNGYVGKVPFIRIAESGADLTVTYDKGTMRMDILSNYYYGDPNFGWLILQANPSLPSYEYLIDSGVNVRIPYPLSSALSRYESAIEYYFEHGE